MTSNHCQIYIHKFLASLPTNSFQNIFRCMFFSEQFFTPFKLIIRANHRDLESKLNFVNIIEGVHNCLICAGLLLLLDTYMIESEFMPVFNFYAEINLSS